MSFEDPIEEAVNAERARCAEQLAALRADLAAPRRRKLPDTRESVTHKFSVSGWEGYLTVGLYPDSRQPGEVFVKMAKEGSTLSGLLDGWSLTMSLALQYGTPLPVLVEKLMHMSFEPCGHTSTPEIGHAKSIYDYIARWLALKFLTPEQRASVPPADASPCPRCGAARAAGRDGLPRCPTCDGVDVSR
jgi:ribonucleoside-diphosphate reductase alpha chain